MSIDNVQEKIVYAICDTIPVVLDKFDSSNLFYNPYFLSLVSIFQNPPGPLPPSIFIS